MNNDLYREAAEAIARDVADRRGIGHEWHQIESEIQEEIMEEWATILRGLFR